MLNRPLKDWYVQLERLPKKSNPMLYLNYMLDGRRHRGQTLQPLESDLYDRTQEMINDEDYWRSSLTRGGHTPSGAYSCLISFPFELSSAEWHHLTDKVLEDFYSATLDYKLGLSIEEKSKALSELKRKTVGVIHRGNHIHLMMPRIVREPRVSLKYSRKPQASLLKMLVNEHLEAIRGINKSQYGVSSDYVKKTASEARADARRAEAVESVWSDILKVAQSARRLGEHEAADNLEKKYRTYLKQIDNGNTTRASSTLRRAEKVASKLDGGVGGKTPTI
jgi:hypothetical protein